jgi:four helix bundle protein
MSEIGEKIQEKCMAFGDRVIKLNDYLLVEECKKEDARRKKSGGGRVPVQHLAVTNLANQLLRAGTSIGANNAEATNAISVADFKSKSFIALKEARESLYWIDMLHRNNYIDDIQYKSIYHDCEEIVKILVTRCKKLNEEKPKEEKPAKK